MRTSILAIGPAESACPRGETFSVAAQPSAHQPPAAAQAQTVSLSQAADEAARRVAEAFPKARGAVLDLLPTGQLLLDLTRAAGVYPGLDFEILPYAFVVVIVGGLGSLPGAMVGSLLVGLLDNFGKALFPELSYFTLFAPMALILAVRPTGLFGRA